MKEEPVNEVQRTIVWFVLWITAIFFVCWLSGCSTSKKNISSLTETIDSSYVQQLESENHFLKNENERLESKIHELDYQAVTFDTSCNQALRDALSRAGLNADSVIKVIQSLKNQVNFYADGSFSAEGQIRSAMRQRDKMQELLSIKDKVIDSISKLKQKTETKVEIKTEYKDRIVKRTWFPWWLLIVAYGLGCLFPPTKIIHLFKK